MQTHEEGTNMVSLRNRKDSVTRARCWRGYQEKDSQGVLAEKQIIKTFLGNLCIPLTPGINFQ